MRVLLDACVLFPTVQREVLLDVAAAGGFTPLWSDRILEEWARATRRLPAGAESVARSEIERMRRTWPEATIDPPADLLDTLALPDAGDIHVLAAAVAGAADALLTANRRDFPPRTLARHGILLRMPDEFLLDLWQSGLDLPRIAGSVLARAEAASGRKQSLHALLKRAGLPRLGKHLRAEGEGREAGAARLHSRPKPVGSRTFS
jgi:predicted nucleic acid-binding protein